jgi:hypothetical protein
MSKNVALFAQIRKVDEAQRLVIGRMVQEVADKAEEIFDYASSKPLFQKWSAEVSADSNGLSLGNVRAMHGKVAAGKVTQMDFNDPELAIDVSVKVVDDAEWAKVLEGVYTGFSIGGSYVKRWEDPTDKKLTRYTASPSEVSLVDRPCIPTCNYFGVHKADGTEAKVEFKAQPIAYEVVTKDGGTLAFKFETVPELDQVFEVTVDKEGTTKWQVTSIEGKVVTVSKYSAQTAAQKAEEAKVLKEQLEYLLKVGYTSDELGKLDGKAVADYVSKAKANGDKRPGEQDLEVTGTDAEVIAFAKFMKANKLTMGNALNAVQKSLSSKPSPELIAEVVALGYPEADALKFDTALLEAVKTALRQVLGKAAIKFADVANKRLPIGNAAQIKAAWNLIHTAKVAGTYKADELSVVKDAITTAWKEVIDKEGPPSAEKMAADRKGRLEKLEKSMSDIGPMASSLMSLTYMCSSLYAEKAAEGDNSPVPAALQSIIARLADVLKQLVDEESGEMLNSLQDMVGDPDASPWMLQMMSRVIDSGFEKALGKATDKPADKVQAMHDLASSFGAKCASGTKAEESAMTKAVNDALAPVQKELADTKARLAKIEAEPLPAKVALKLVTKSDDGGNGANKDVAVVKNDKGEVNEVASLIKGIHENGGKPLFS